MTADVLVILVAVTAVITGACAEPCEFQVKTVIEYGGKERLVAPLKPLRVDDAIFTTLPLSFVSVKFAEVNCCICTVPVGALAPLKVTGRVELRDKLNTTAE
jgi:hypothetical protein